MAATDWVILELNEALKRWRQGVRSSDTSHEDTLSMAIYGDQQVLSKPSILAGRCRGQAGGRPLYFPISLFLARRPVLKIQISPFADSLANLTIDPIPSTEPDFEDLLLPITGDSIP